MKKEFRGKCLTFWVLNRYEAAERAPEEPYVVIAIRDPDAPETPLHPSPHCRAVLRLQFHDRNELRPGKKITLMSSADARVVLALIKGHLSDIHTVVCHCARGLGRSPAVAAALSRIVQGEDRFFFENFAPNQHIYHTLLAVQDEVNVL